jgi:ubiquinone/menaquinone biosynthesis C-methylase UbiE
VFIDRLLSIGPIRRGIWKIWYPYLTRKLRRNDVLFLNYAFEQSPPQNLALEAADEPNRGCIQLYHHVATQTDLRDKHVLEVSCGHGGGASYLTRTLHPARYTALDLNPDGIQFCRERHQIEGLSFVQGDAENLPFGNETFDAVINVEASHCYSAFPRFLAEIARVLRPGGQVLYADFRFDSGITEWESALAASPLRQRDMRAIDAEVLRGMERNSACSEALIERQLPRFLHSLGRDFAGVTGSRIHRALQERQMSYRSYRLEKAVGD